MFFLSSSKLTKWKGEVKKRLDSEYKEGKIIPSDVTESWAAASPNPFDQNVSGSEDKWVLFEDCFWTLSQFVISFAQ